LKTNLNQIHGIFDKEFLKQLNDTYIGEHVVAALKSLGFEDYIAEVQEVFDDHQKQLKAN
jgi:hypothetical protein